MSGYRVKLDLSSFYADRREYAFVLVNPKWKFVKSLQEHVENLFNLSNIEFVTGDSCYFPPLEHISVIKQKDILKVVSCQPAHEENLGTEITHKKKKKKKVKEAEEYPQTVEHTTPSKKIKLDKVPAGSSTTGDNDDSIIKEVKLSVKKLKSIFENKYEELSKDSTLFCNSEDLDRTSNGKRKRKRRRKSKKDAGNVSTNNILKDDQPIAKESPKVSLHKSRSPGHIRFDEEGQSVIRSDDKKSNEKIPVQFKNYLDALNNLKPRMITPKVISNCISDNVRNEADKNSSQATEILPYGDSLLKNVESSFTENNNEKTQDIMHVAEQHETNGTVNEAPLCQATILNTLKTKDILSIAEPLEGNPAEGDVLLFKIHRSENDEPLALSDYICGKFEGIEESTNFLKIFLIDGQDQLQDPERKCYPLGLHIDSSGYLHLKYEDLFDIKVLKM